MGYESELKVNYKKRKNVGVIGCGIRVSSMLQTLRELDMNTHITAICDIAGDKVLQRLQNEGEDITETRIFNDADAMLDEMPLDGIIIGTRSDTHVHYAKKVIERNIPLLLEKPITTSVEELCELRKVFEKSQKRVLVSFPLRTTPISRLVREIVESGKIGTVEHVQAFNYVPYGGVYFHNWYRSLDFGGMFFEKSTHDFDNINFILGTKPKEIFAMTSKQIFKGDNKDDKLCYNCEHQMSCLESPLMQKNFVLDNPQGDLCAFSSGAKNHDSSGVLIRYENGMHVSYEENLFARKSAATRGARLSGYKGTIDFDWYQNKVVVHMHHTPRKDTYEYDSGAMNHFGGDKNLLFDFVRLMEHDPTCEQTLDAAFTSTLMCIAARESARTGKLVPISWPE